MKNVNENEKQALTVIGNNTAENDALAVAEFSSGLGFQPKTMEEFQLIKELLESAAQLDGLEFPKLKSVDLAKTGETFDLVDAYQGTINVTVNGEKVPKLAVTFIIELNGELFAVMKDGNPINVQYAEFFSKFKTIGRPQRRNGYKFVEATWLNKTAGNYPIILQKVKAEKQIASKGK